MVISLLFYYACVSSGKGNVVFISQNFSNVLRWDPAPPRVPGQEVLYSVDYQIDTDSSKFIQKADCQNISSLTCDLTSVTPAVYDVRYRARVKVEGMVYGYTNTFKPVAETVLGAPVLSMTYTSSSLHVNVSLPLGPNQESIQDILQRIKKGPSEATVDYSLYITEPAWAKQEIKNTTGQFVVTLKNDQEYCGYVLYKPAFEWGRPPSDNTSFCVTLPDNPWMVLPWPIMTLSVVVVVMAVAVCCMWNYTKGLKKKPMPYSLQDIPSCPPEVFHLPIGDCHISDIVISPVSNATIYAKILPPRVSSPLGEYGHTNTIPWTEESLHHREDSFQSSDIYGAVALQEDDNLSPIHTHGSNQNGPSLTSIKTVPLLENVDIYQNSEAKPLLLETQRGSDGQLILPMLSFGVQKTFKTEALPKSETKPLLSYLIVSEREKFVSLSSLDNSECSDSGCDENSVPTPTHDYCNANYLQQTSYKPERSLSSDSGTYDSAYRQHWTPEIKFETNDSNYAWNWSGLKEEGEREDETNKE